MQYNCRRGCEVGCIAEERVQNDGERMENVTDTISKYGEMVWHDEKTHILCMHSHIDETDLASAM
jgi:hypothetical protein